MLRLRGVARAAILFALSFSALVAAPPATLARQVSTAAPSGSRALDITAPASVEIGILDPSGIRLSISVGDARDPAKGTQQSRPPQGHWVVLSVGVTNVGSQAFELRPSDFQIRTDDAIVYSASSDTGVSAFELSPVTLNVGETVQGDAVFDIPTGKALQTAMFQANGTSQFVIAALTR